MSAIRALIAVVLLIAVVGLVPFSSWELRNIGDAWRGKVIPGLNGQFGPVQSAIELPANSTDPLAKLDYHYRSGRNPGSDFEFTKQMVNEHSNEASVMGALGRLTCNALMPNSKEPDMSFRKPVAERSLLVGKALTTADPENAFGPLLTAMASYVLSNNKAVWEDLHEAARRPHYRTYPMEEAAARVKAMELAHGYRGQGARLSQYAGILFPELASVRNYAQKVCREGTLKERLAIAHIGLTMVRSEEVVIAGLVGAGIIQIACCPPGAALPKDKTGRVANVAWLRAQVEKEGLKESEEFWRAVGLVSASRHDTTSMETLDEGATSYTAMAALCLPFLIAGAFLSLLSLVKQPTVRESTNFPTLQKLGAYLIMPALLLLPPICLAFMAYQGRRWELNWLEIGVMVAYCLVATRSRLRVRENSAIVLLAIGAVILVAGIGFAIRQDARYGYFLKSIFTEVSRVKQASGLNGICGLNDNEGLETKSLTPHRAGR